MLLEKEMLQVTGQRVAPWDRDNPLEAAIGLAPEVWHKDHNMRPHSLKNRLGYGGGYRIQEETLKKSQRSVKFDKTEDVKEEE